ncbi:hypothetical protein TSUD_344250 [Trifolium subterraneum]|nr:hypothetical protein TSUD_344250 [Trifolium subterraneum]
MDLMFPEFDEVSQTGQFGRNFSMEKFNASFDYGDGAGPSNHYSSPNFAEQHAYKNLNDLILCKIGEKQWNTVTAHVKECDVDDEEEEERVKQHAYKNLNDLNPLPIDSLVETSTEMWPSTSISQSHLDLMFPEFDEVSQTGQFGRNFSMEKFNASFDYGDGAGPSNHYSSPNFAEQHAYKNLNDLILLECSTSVNFVDSGTDISNNGKPKAVWWCKIRAVIKWGISVKKVAAAKRHY